MPNSLFNVQCFFNLFISSLHILDFIILLSLDNDVLETSKHRAVLCNILSQIFIDLLNESQHEMGLSRL